MRPDHEAEARRIDDLQLAEVEDQERSVSGLDRSSSCSSAPVVARSRSPLTAITVARPSRPTSTRNWLCTRSKADAARRRTSLTQLM
jgi:hypothetical protein